MLIPACLKDVISNPGVLNFSDRRQEKVPGALKMERFPSIALHAVRRIILNLLERAWRNW